MGSSVKFVSEIPDTELTGGVFTIKYQSGGKAVTIAMPAWLVRLSHQKVADLLKQQDTARAG